MLDNEDFDENRSSDFGDDGIMVDQVDPITKLAVRAPAFHVAKAHIEV